MSAWVHDVTNPMETCSWCTAEVLDSSLVEVADGARICPECRAEEAEVCPEHGLQAITGHGVCGPRHDPYGTVRMACGCETTSFGPGEPDIIVRRRR